jgi:PAS domain S-box-containing protein
MRRLKGKMTAKMRQSPAINPNPVINVEKDGTVLYSNKAGEPLLHEWGVAVGEKLPSYIGDIVENVISRNITEKMEVKAGKKVYWVAFHALPEEECVNIYGFDRSDWREFEEKFMRSKAQEEANLEMADILDIPAVQSLMEDLYELIHITIALVDLKGNIPAIAGRQEICSKFHRAHPETCKHCVESDTKLSMGVAPGEFKLYKCKNNMWDVATPLIVGGRHIGNVFSGHFFFEDEPLEYDLFRSQARKYGFNEEEYIAALEKVPRLSREAVNKNMSFFMKLANMLSQLSHSNFKLSQSLAERDSLLEALQESERRERAHSDELKTVLDAVPVAVFITHDPQVRQLTGNRLSYEWLQLPVGTNFSKSAPEGERPETFKLFKDGVEIQPADMPSQMVAAGIEVNNCELDIVSADGKKRHVLGNARPLRDEQGNLRGSISAFIDITERKKAEETIRLSNLYNRSLIEASLDPLVTIGPAGKITDVNNSTETITGRSRDELIGSDFSDYFTEPEKAREGYQRAFKEGLVRDYSLEIQHKDGHITPVLYNASVYRDENGKVIGIFAAARDIAAIKKAEEKIQTLANAVESSNDAIITKSLDGIITSWNNGAEKVYGYLAEEVLGKNMSTLEPDNTKGETKHLIEKIKQGERVQHYETLRMKKDGTIINVSVTLSPVFDSSGKLVAISTIGRDITENKKAEEALRSSNLYNRSLIEASLDPLVTIGHDGKITDVNNATVQVTGYSRRELIGTDFSDYFTEPEKARKGYQQVFMHGEVRDYPLEIRHKNGHITPVLYNASVYKDESGRIIGVFAAARDISDLKKAEEALKKAYNSLEEKVKERTVQLEEAYNSLLENERRLNEAQKIAHIGNWDWDIVNEKTYWSDEIYRIGRTTPREFGLPYNEFLSCVHPDDRSYVDSAIKEALNGKTFSIDHRIITTDGEERTVHAQAEVIFDENTPIRMRGIVQDITERKRAEEKIERLANAIESSNDAIITLSLEGIITSWNKAAEQVYGYLAEEVLGKSVSILAPSHLRDETKKLTDMVIQGEKVHQYETLRLRKDGTLINVSITLSPIFDVTGKLVAISGIVRDVTEKKKAEEALANIEVARKKEIHHRIKNNLQVISSLLDLQAEKFKGRKNIEDLELLEAFRESQDRVISMALIHEELYKGGGFETLNFSPYIRELAENLFKTYSLGDTEIALSMDLEENIFFDMDTAVPLGMIVNELVSNSFKHAFIGRDKGEIRIKLGREEPTESEREEHESTGFILKISDNGVGIPENLDIEKLDSLGFQLVTSLVDQLDGELEVKRHNGTEFTIKFTVTKK